MGAAHSTEATLTAVVLAGALGFGYYSYMTPGGEVRTTGSTDANSATKSKKKKKKGKGLEANEPIVPTSSSSTSRLVDSSNSIPGQFDQPPPPPPPPLTPPPTSNSKVKKPKKRASAKQLSATRETLPSSSSITPQPPPQTDAVKSRGGGGGNVQVPSTSTTADTEGSWTRVVSRRRQGADDQSIVDVTTSDAGLTSSVTGNSSPVEEEEEEEGEGEDSKDKLQTLAEKLVPKAPQTPVDDMLADQNQSTLSRVMRVQPLPDEKPAPGFSWRDYEDVDADGEDDGWGVVKSKRSRPPRETNASTTPSTSKPAEASTKKQRQNEKKREAQKAAKVAAEKERLATLAKHKRELEKTRIIEQSRSGGKTGKVSGGMAPVVDAAGKLVWE